jgi:hypothetical protein
MQDQRNQACSLAMQIVSLLKDQPRHVAIDAIDISRVLFRPPVIPRLEESPESASHENPVIALQSS